MSALGLACASSPAPPPAPPSVEAPAPRPVTAFPTGVDPLGALEPATAHHPPAPWLWPSVRWEPAEPSEGSAALVRVALPPGAREPLQLEAELDGAPVRLARTPDGWVGLAPVSIGAVDPALLTLRLGVGPDSTAVWLAPVRVRGRAWPSTTLRIESGTRDVSPETRARLDRERALIRATVEEATPEWLAHDGFAWPRRDRITSPFGQRRMFGGEVRSLHLGVDVAGRPGERVRAAGAGRVALTGHFLLQGRAVYLDHGLGVYTAYFHLSRIDVSEGEQVERGALLGRVGATGRVTGPHLHWSLYVAGRSVDPRSVLELRIADAFRVEEEERP